MQRIALIFIIFATVATANAQSYYGSAKQYDPRPQITVTGEATVYVKPDKIEMRFGITTDDLELTKAKSQNTEIFKKARQTIKELGVAEKDVCTDHLFTEPRWEYPYDIVRKNFLGYFVRNNFVITLSETEKIEPLLDGLLQAGVNNVYDMEFQTSELKQYREEARESAVKAAKEKADKMAAVLGEKVKSVIDLQENPVSSNYYFSSWWGGYARSGSSMTQNYVSTHYDEAPGNSGSDEGTVAVGKLAVRAKVTITFELEKKE